MDVVAVFEILGSVATIAAAGAALATLKQWRKQIAGASHHELAKKLSAALRKAVIARREVIDALRTMSGESLDAQIRRVLVPDALQRTAGSLSDAVEELETLEGQVAVQWGTEVADLVELIRSESKGLAVHAAMHLEPKFRETARGKIVFARQTTLAPSFTGGAWEKAVNNYTALAEKWLAVHVGREGATAMSVADLVEQRKHADVEAARLADPEFAAIDRERKEWLDELGGPDGLLRLIREQEAANRGERAAERRPLPEPTEPGPKPER